MTAIAAQVAAALAEEHWRTHGLQDVRLGVTREGYAASQLPFAEQLVALVHGPTPRGIAEAVYNSRTVLTGRLHRREMFGPQAQEALTEELGDLARRVAAMAPAA